MHQRQSFWGQFGKMPNGCSSGRRDATGMKHFLGCFGGLHNVGIRQGRAISGMSEQVAAEQRACGFLE